MACAGSGSGEAGSGGVVMLQEAKFAGSIVFDRMDFSCVGVREDEEGEASPLLSRDARFVDLNYFRSNVPSFEIPGHTSPT